MTPSLTPADLYRHSLTLLLEKDIDGRLALSDEHIVAEFPYAPDGFPAKLEGGAALAASRRGHPEYVDLRETPRPEVHATREPGTIVAEWRGTGRMVSSGAAYDMPYVAVAKVRDGRMTHDRDYGNPAAIPGSPGDAAFLPAGPGETR
ncbi:nuclear transport factor 2 family protein [Streptomyces sp. S07_1.15]|uniref:nuclear transport factor 2 family protein n=1 Tax=Streptomyces sp. S07_1.15 TaxID=2873925 RepID=UPI001D147076|nr:nuclear transport factor 2 family protein [Streptomyces sp. S07_1.15]MCC3650867.1 nuclear transport factor 2 family protein [Streptomyces sp. S07_1.15]